MLCSIASFTFIFHVCCNETPLTNKETIIRDIIQFIDLAFSRGDGVDLHLDVVVLLGGFLCIINIIIRPKSSKSPTWPISETVWLSSNWKYVISSPGEAGSQWKRIVSFAASLAMGFINEARYERSHSSFSTSSSSSGLLGRGTNFSQNWPPFVSIG